MKRVARKIIWGLVAAFVLIIAFSSAFPGRVKFVDSIRMFAQRPVIKLFGKVKTEYIPIYGSDEGLQEVDISLKELLDFTENLPPGSIFLTRTRNYAITEFIPGEWKHSGIFLGKKSRVMEYFAGDSLLAGMLDTLMNDSDVYVLDSYSEGVSVHPIDNLSNMREQSFLTAFAAFTYDGPFFQKTLYIKEALGYLGTGYDYDWLTEDHETIFCSELLYIAFKPIGIDMKARTTTFNRDIFTPDDLFRYLNSAAAKRKKFTFYGKLVK